MCPDVKVSVSADLISADNWVSVLEIYHIKNQLEKIKNSCWIYNNIHFTVKVLLGSTLQYMYKTLSIKNHVSPNCKHLMKLKAELFDDIFIYW